MKYGVVYIFISYTRDVAHLLTPFTYPDVRRNRCSGLPTTESGRSDGLLISDVKSQEYWVHTVYG